MLKTSARNRLLGTVIGITPGAVNDEIRLRIAGGHRHHHPRKHPGTGLADGKGHRPDQASSVIVGVPGRACACRPATSCRAPSRPCAPAR